MQDSSQYTRQFTLDYLVNGSDKNLDLTFLIKGLEQDTNIFPQRPDQPNSAAVASIYAEPVISNLHPTFALPSIYYSHLPPPYPSTQQIADYTEDTLFYMIHGPQLEHPSTNLRVQAIKQLYSRSWTYHDDKANSVNHSIWTLDCSHKSTLTNLSYLDLTGAQKYNDMAMSSNGSKSNSPFWLTFSPSTWTFAFTSTTPKLRPISCDELLK